MAGVVKRRAAGVMLMAAAGAAPEGARAGDLAPYAWQQRVLLVFAAGDGPELRQQRQRLAAARDALEERDMAVLAVIGASRLEHWLGPDKGGDPAALRARFQVPAQQGFRVILVGKDRLEKWRSTRPADPETLFGIIDAMPMRRGEAGRRG